MAKLDRWLVLSADAPAADPLRDLLAEGLLALGGASILDEGDRLTTYLQPPDEPDRFLREASSFLDEWLGQEAPPLSYRWQDDEDWAREWKRGLAPRRIGERIVVKPTWCEWDRAPHDVVIDIDPEMAFGTGEHPTTRSCVRLLEGTLTGGERVLDVGSGSGILSICAAHLRAREVVALESDPDANLNARENLERNHVADRVRLIEDLATPQTLRPLGDFDVVVANILSGVIRPLLPAFRRAVARAEDPAVIVSGILHSEREEVLAAAETAGLRLDLEDREEEWWSARLSPHSV